MKNIVLALALAATSLSAQEAKEVTVAELKFAIGDGWKSVTPSSAMRAATLEVTPEGATEALQANFFHFGGDVDGNIARWRNQVQGPEPKIEKLDFAGREVVIYHAEGTYNDPFGGKGAQENYALLGAIIPVPGAGPVVIKLAGPKDQVAKLQPAFKALATSPFAKK